MLDLSIIIVSWNVKDLLQRCLESILQHPLTKPLSENYERKHKLKWMQNSVNRRREVSLPSGIQFEAFVVDNASLDGSAEMVRERFPQVHLIENEENLGFAAANNQAIRRSQGRYVLLLNPDTVVCHDALTKLIDFLEGNPEVAVAGPKLLHPDGQIQHSAFAFPTLPMAFLDFFPIHHRLINSPFNGRYPRRLYEGGEPFPIDHPLGACLMARREAIEQVGLLDEGFFIYCEEIDWCMRAKKAGWQIYCVPQAEVVHYVAQSTQQARDEMFVQLWKSRYLLFAKHYSRFYQWAVRRIVRLGLWRERRKAQMAYRQGRISEEELKSRLAACRQIAGM